MQDDPRQSAPPVVAPPRVNPPPIPKGQEPAHLEMRVQPARRPSWFKRFLAPFAVLLAGLGKYKTLLVLGAKFILPLVKTFGSMFVMIWVYSMMYGWPFAAGFVLLIFVHECGHLLAARKLGLRVSAPMFIPFVGALITLKEMPRNAWIEAQVALGGPLLGSLGAAICLFLYEVTGNPLFAGLASAGFFINLINLTPIGFLDGGRIVTALSPWMWLGGLVILVSTAVLRSSPILWIILIFSLPRLFSLFRARTEEEKRYYEVSSSRRWIMGTLYFGLAAALAVGTWVAETAIEAARQAASSGVV